LDGYSPDQISMSAKQVGSLAFHQALLRSERLRILVVLGTICVGFAIRTTRTLVLHNRENLELWLLTSLLIILFIAYESLMLRAVNGAIRNQRDLSRLVWASNVIVETLLPAFALAFLTSPSIDPIYRPLANPSVLVFFLFIILSTLRLNPGLCRLSGLVSAIGYLAASSYLGWKPSLAAGVSLLSPQKVVVTYAITFVIGGLVAGLVANEIRKQVEAALREAETRREMERLEHDLEVARSIQQSLLPAVMPKVGGFEIAGWNHPADQTGGDFYDWEILPDGSALVMLADVTGHGIGPALLAAVCRAYARAHFGVEANISSAMQRTNAAISEDLKEGRFVTFVAASCRPGNSQVDVLSAGHGPLFRYVWNEDRFERRDAQGFPLGLFPGLPSDPPLSFTMERGDMLILITDGFYEWANAQDEQFGKERMEQTIRASREKSPGEIIATLYNEVAGFAGATKQQDDLTAVIIKRT